jgi:hypothetical protein
LMAFLAADPQRTEAAETDTASLSLPTPSPAAPSLPAGSGSGSVAGSVAADVASIGALTVFADADESIGVFPLTVKLEVEVLPGTGLPPYRYHWDFGDGTGFSDEPNPIHTYRIPGSFRASVVVIDARGELDQDYVDLSVNEPRGSGAISARELRAWVLEQGQLDGGSDPETDASHPGLVPGSLQPQASD